MASGPLPPDNMRTLVWAAATTVPRLACGPPPQVSTAPASVPPPVATILNKLRARYARVTTHASDSDKAAALPALSAALRGLLAFPRDKRSGSRSALVAGVLGLLVLRMRRRKLHQLTEEEGAASHARRLRRERVHELAGGARNIVIVTTASLPWMTGTAVNPALRAVALARDGHSVTLVVPWLESAAEQRRVYGQGRTFRRREDQGAQVRKWLGRQHDAGKRVKVRFYDGVYSEEFGSILATGDITALFGSAAERDVVVLEEPEHLTWHHAGRPWTEVFELVVGVVHTNYLEYAGKHGALGPLRAAFLGVLNMWVCSAHCHRVIRLSAAVQHLPGAVTENVHGVRDAFLRIGEDRQGGAFQRGAYFLAKMLWTKGYADLLDLLEMQYDGSSAAQRFDLFGAGPDLEAIRARVRGSPALAAVRVHGVVVDHASEYLRDYQVYVNASRSDVVCTATAEALAMGKRVVILRHPSNHFFARFRNTSFYDTPQQFAAQLQHALQKAPLPLSPRERADLGWAAATARFYNAVRLDAAPPYRPRVAAALAAAHRAACEALVTSPAHNAIRARYHRARQDAASPLPVCDPDAPSAPAAS